MSLLDDVSIVVTPNGYKAGELYAVVPVPTEGAELLTNGDFASDLTGWTGYGTRSATGGVATIGASANSGIFQGVLTQGVRYNVTVNVTSYDGVGTAQFVDNNGNNLYTITSTGIQTFTFISAATTSNLIIRGLSNALFSVSSVSVKEYTAADMDVTRATDATRVDEAGLIKDVLSNVPRIDYTGGGCPHILAEPQRTNLLTYSEDFSNAIYIKDSTVSVGTTNNVSPSGESNATKIDVTASGRIYANLTTDTYVSSIFIKAGTFAYFKLAGVQVDLVAETNANGTIESLGNGWFKVGVNYTGNRPFQIQAYPDGSYATHTTSGNYFIWGAQIEAGSYATSYIPTSGSTVTRNQDIFTRDGIGSLINSTEGVLFVEMAALVEVDTARRHITLNDGGASNKVVIRYESTGVITARYDIGGSAQASIAFATTITNSHKIAFKYKENDFALWVDGTEVGTDTSGSVLSANTINKLSFDSGNGTFPFFGKVKQLQVYKTALTDAQLTSLTS